MLQASSGTADERVQNRHEAGGTGPPKCHLNVHSQRGRCVGFPVAATTRWQRQQKRLLATGGFDRDPSHRPLRTDGRHAAASAWVPHECQQLADVSAENAQRSSDGTGTYFHAGTTNAQVQFISGLYDVIQSMLYSV